MHALLVSIYFYRYLLLVPFAIVEGPILSIYCGFLLHEGTLTLLPTYIALMAGDLIGDAGWYGVGHYFGHRFIRRFGDFFNVHEGDVKKVTDIFHRHKDTILLASKLTTGFGFALATLITAGMVKIPFRRFLMLNFIGQFIWTAVLLAAGYFFGNLYSQIQGVFGKMSLVAGFIAIIFALFGFGKYLGRRLTDHV